MNIKPQYVDWFRNSAPYINAHRGCTFVIEFGGEAAVSPGFAGLIHDIALLDSLGVRLVLVHGARPQIERAVAREGRVLRYIGNLRVTDPDAMEAVKEAVGKLRLDIEALLSMGLANSPMAGASIRTTSGNFVTAKPIGVRDGVDFSHTGEVRRIDTATIRHRLDQGDVVIVSPIGFSPTGEVFNLSAEEVATRVAVELHAAKLIFIAEAQALTDTEGGTVRQLTLEAAKRWLAEHQRDAPAEENADAVRLLMNAVHACRNGVRRTHVIERSQDGALITELFTRDGVGIMVSGDLYDDTRNATIDDVGGILELIRPLEDNGTLVRRSREKLETEIARFMVMERDGAIIACAALYPVDAASRDLELACVAVHADYQKVGRGESLMFAVDQQARSLGARRLFVLTTQTTHWFREFGFEPAGIDDLPAQRKRLYNYQRGSRVLIKPLD